MAPLPPTTHLLRQNADTLSPAALELWADAAKGVEDEVAIAGALECPEHLLRKYGTEGPPSLRVTVARRRKLHEALRVELIKQEQKPSILEAHLEHSLSREAVLDIVLTADETLLQAVGKAYRDLKNCPEAVAIIINQLAPIKETTEIELGEDGQPLHEGPPQWLLPIDALSPACYDKIDPKALLQTLRPEMQSKYTFGISYLLTKNPLWAGLWMAAIEEAREGKGVVTKSIVLEALNRILEDNALELQNIVTEAQMAEMKNWNAPGNLFKLNRALEGEQAAVTLKKLEESTEEEIIALEGEIFKEVNKEDHLTRAITWGALGKNKNLAKTWLTGRGLELALKTSGVSWKTYITSATKTIRTNPGVIEKIGNRLKQEPAYGNTHPWALFVEAVRGYASEDETELGEQMWKELLATWPKTREEEEAMLPYPPTGHEFKNSTLACPAARKYPQHTPLMLIGNTGATSKSAAGTWLINQVAEIPGEARTKLKVLDDILNTQTGNAAGAVAAVREAVSPAVRKTHGVTAEKAKTRTIPSHGKGQ